MDSSGIDYKVEYLTLMDALADLGLRSFSDIRELAEKQRAGEARIKELVQKYNEVVEDRDAVIRTVRLLPIKMLSGMVADMQAIVADTPRFERMTAG
ncbi:hypothetical protein [Nitrososphaera sp.]|uniref:hypothetical protein n=1 Tax=Nitrososphaera sp. TaxID=1971748 RepID=UPI00307DE381